MELTKEKINSLKKQHGTIFQYKAKDGKSCILKAPSIKTLDACRAISNGSSIKFDQALVDNCIIEGDDVFKNDTPENERYRLGLFDWLGGIILKVEGELKEL